MPSKLLLNSAPFHFVGIGGIGMSGLAEALHAVGVPVQGSDQSASANTARLLSRGINVRIGHAAENLSGAKTVVWSSAVSEDNPELKRAREIGVAVIHRAEILRIIAERKDSIAVAGSHGKTTTTSMMGTAMIEAGLDPTVVNGGVMNSVGSNVRVGGGGWLVAEADESDGTFNRLNPYIAIVTNIDPEHLDHYGDFAALLSAFRSFVNSVPFWGHRILCIDCPNVRRLVETISEESSCSTAGLLTYGESEDAMVRITSIESTETGVKYVISCSCLPHAQEFDGQSIEVAIPGRHNAINSGAVVAFGAASGLISYEKLASSMANFAGVQRRYTVVGRWNGATVVDDYAHHPREIACVIDAARSRASGRIHVVMQPHRYSRLDALWDDFVDVLATADTTTITPMYSAGEEAIEGVNSDELARAISQKGSSDVVSVQDAQAVIERLAYRAGKGDIVLYLGAGSISVWARDAQSALERYGAEAMDNSCCLGSLAG